MRTEILIYCEKCGAQLEITQSYSEGGNLYLHTTPCGCKCSRTKQQHDSDAPELKGSVLVTSVDGVIKTARVIQP